MVTPSGSGAEAIGRITVESYNGAQLLRLVGEIDETAVAAYEQQAGAGSSNVPTADGIVNIVDMADVTFLSSAGVRFLIQHTREARGHGQRPTLRGLTNPARRVLQLTGVTSLFQTVA